MGEGRGSQLEQTTIDAARVQVRPSSLFDAWLTALDGDEFEQITDGRMFGVGNERCVYGVLGTMVQRAGGRSPVVWDAWYPGLSVIASRAAALLGYDGLDHANDAGCSFALLAPALRAARIEVERG